MNCNEAMAALVASLENGTVMNDEQREHVRTCARCGGMLDSAKELLRVVPGDVEGSRAIDAAVAATEKEVHRQRFWRGVKLFGGVLLLLAAAAAGLLVGYGEARAPEAALFAGVGFFVSLLVAAPLLILIWLVRGRQRIHRRLGPGRMLAGVCLGLAEALKLDVQLVRIVFAVLLFFDGAGASLYILLILAMPVHPDDRQHLLRFRVRRWWRRTMHAEQRAG